MCGSGTKSTESEGTPPARVVLVVPVPKDRSPMPKAMQKMVKCRQQQPRGIAGQFKQTLPPLELPQQQQQRQQQQQLVGDREIADQYRRLYGTVHTWSRHFLAPPPTIPTLTQDEAQLVRVVVLLDSLDPILENNPLRRSLMEGLVGHQIPFMLDGNSMSPIHLKATSSHLSKQLKH